MHRRTYELAYAASLDSGIPRGIFFFHLTGYKFIRDAAALGQGFGSDTCVPSPTLSVGKYNFPGRFNGAPPNAIFMSAKILLPSDASQNITLP